MEFKEIGEVLRICRQRVGFSQEEMAFQLNYTQSGVSKIEVGHLHVDLVMFFKWLEVTKSFEFAMKMLDLWPKQKNDDTETLEFGAPENVIHISSFNQRNIANKREILMRL